MTKKIKVAHVISGLGTGGAEMMLLKLLSHTDSLRFESEVMSLTDIGSVGREMVRSGVLVSNLGMSRWGTNARSILRLARWVRNRQIDVVQTWMYHADLIGGISAKLAGDIPVRSEEHTSELQSPTNLVCRL